MKTISLDINVEVLEERSQGMVWAWIPEIGTYVDAESTEDVIERAMDVARFFLASLSLEELEDYFTRHGVLYQISDKGPVAADVGPRQYVRSTTRRRVSRELAIVG